MFNQATLPSPRSWGVLLGVATLGVAGSAAALDWPNFRGPDYNGISQETEWSSTWPPDGPKVLWRAKVGVGFSSFAVANGRAYTTGNSGKGKNEDTVFCFDAVTGKELWRHTYAEDLGDKYYEGGTSATPTVDGNRVYTLSKTGQLICLNAQDGRVVWQKGVPDLVKGKVGKEAEKPTWGFASSVVVQGGRLFVNVGTYGTALDKEGNVIWTSGPEASGYSSFVPYTLAGKPALALAAAKEAVGLDPASGAVLWKHPWKTSYDVNAADLIVSEDLVFISSGYNHGGTVVRLNGSQATALWESKAMRNQFNSCVLIEGHLYGVDEDQLRCLEFLTGAVKWTEKSVGKGSLMAADGQLIVLSEKGELMVAPASPEAFQPTARAQILGGKCWSSPVLANGRIYARNAAGDVVCVDVSK